MAKSDPNLLTQTEYAGHRKARGLSGGTKQAVHKAVDEKRISVFGPDKLIDPILADAQWERNTRVRAVAGAPGGQPPVATAAPRSGDLLDPANQVPEPPAAGEDKDPAYQHSRARQAAADARMAELEVAEKEKQLVRIDQVEAQLASRLAPVREALLQLPARMSPELAPMSDPGRIQTLLEGAIHQLLEPLSRSREVRAQEGAG